MSLVKYQVERRPISANGTVYRGLKNGDYVLTLTNPENIADPTKVFALSSGSSGHASFVPVKGVVPTLDAGSSGKIYSHVQEVIGEPWLVHSTHFSIESALDSAAPLAGAIGSENVRIVQVLSHTTTFKLQ